MKKGNIVLLGLYDPDSFSVCILHAVLKKAGFNVSSIFLKKQNRDLSMTAASNDEISCLVKQIKKLEPVLVGISVRSVFFQLVCRITRELKQETASPVILGGVHPTIRPKQCLECADFVCVGEGEEAIAELAERLSKGEDIDGIKNLCFKMDGAVIRNDVRPLIQDLDSIPFPDYSSENKYFVENGRVTAHRHCASMIMTSRGCPFSCTFCCNSALRQIYVGKGSYVRRRSVDNVIEELIRMKECGNLKEINFQDDVFTFDIAWLEEFCSKYKKAVNLPFYCNCHPKATGEEMIRMLKEAGLSSVGIGIQSGCEKIRHEYFQRYDTNEEILKATRILHKYGIDFHCDILMENPLETEKDRQEAFNLFLEMPKPFYVNTHSLTYFPELKLTNLLLEKGIISEDDIEDRRQESYKRWCPHLDLTRNKENMFWADLYFLASRKLPKWIVVRLSRSVFLKRHPKLLTLLLIWVARSRSGQYLLYCIRKCRQH